jgi:dipeptidyl aminopeptidase/acylaminoacyl peptidase
MKNLIPILIALLMMTNLNAQSDQLPGNTSLPTSDVDLKKLAALETEKFKYSVEDFFAKPKASSFKFSPEGTYLSFKEKDENLKNHVYIKNIATGKVTRAIEEKEELIRGYGWANDNRLLYIMDKGGDENYHLYAVDLDGSNEMDLTPFDGVKADILNGLKEDKSHMIISMNKNNPAVFEPYKINIETGELEQLFENKDVQNPISGYSFDKNGDLRAYVKMRDGVENDLYYATEKNQFKKLKELNWKETFGIVGFNYASDNPHEAYVVSNLESDKVQIYLYDLKKDKVIKKLFSHPDYDVSEISVSRHRGYELDCFAYEGEKQKVVPVSPYFKKMHQLISEKFVGYNYYITDETDDESKYLIFIQSDKLYGKYFSFDPKTEEFKEVYDLMPQLKEDDMSVMMPITFESRDGKIIHGYFTMPKGTKLGQKVPVIVNPHGGPQGIRDSWGFNPEAQLFASRGYATLHVNFRISGGYGKDFLQCGFKQVGRKAMDDVEDGLKYIVDQGWVDENRAAIYGGSHGGYAVLRGLTKTPELYACGVDYVGISSIFTFMKSIPAYWQPYMKIIKEIWYDEDVPEEKTIMEEVSPIFHIDKIKKPLLVVQGANDPRVNINEADQIVEGLRKKGIDVPYMVKYDEGHGFGKEENRIAFYSTMMGFFAQHLK